MKEVCNKADFMSCYETYSYTLVKGDAYSLELTYTLTDL